MPNTYTASLNVAYLQHPSVVPQIGRFAPLKDIATVFSVAPWMECGDMRPHEIKKITAGPTALSNPASFNAGNSTFGNLDLTVQYISTPYQISNADLNDGARLANLAVYALKVHCTAIQRIINSFITVANFPATPLVTSSGSFGMGSLPALRTVIGKADKRSLHLHPDWYASLASTPGFTTSAGWDAIGEVSDWTNADTNCVGFAGSGTALVAVAASPTKQAAWGDWITQEIFSLPGLEIESGCHTWFQTDSRTYWVSYDTIFGCTVADSTAGILLKSAA